MRGQAAGLQKPPWQVPVQHSPVSVQPPPSGTQVWPVVTQLPFWHCRRCSSRRRLVQAGELTQTLFDAGSAGAAARRRAVLSASGRQAPGRRSPSASRGWARRRPSSTRRARCTARIGRRPRCRGTHAAWRSSATRRRRRPAVLLSCRARRSSFATRPDRRTLRRRRGTASSSGSA